MAYEKLAPSCDPLNVYHVFGQARGIVIFRAARHTHNTPWFKVLDKHDKDKRLSLTQANSTKIILLFYKEKLFTLSYHVSSNCNNT